MEACRFDEEAKSCVLDNFRNLAILLKQNTQHSRKWTKKKKKRHSIPNKHLIFPFPLRINTVKVTFSLGTDMFAYDDLANEYTISDVLC